MTATKSRPRNVNAVRWSGVLPDGTNENDERYTTAELDREIRELTGVKRYDLDAFACDEAHLADSYYTKERSAFTHPWFGDVWGNFPFSIAAKCISRAWEQMGQQSVKTITFLMPATRVEQPFWQTLVEPWRDGHDQSDLRFAKLLRSRAADLLRHTYGQPDTLWSIATSLKLHYRLHTFNLARRPAFGKPGNVQAHGQNGSPFPCAVLFWHRL